MIKKSLKKVGLVLLVVLIIAQFFGPEKNDGDIASVEAFIADTNPPEDVQLIMKSACFDCHSDHTRYPWYNNITPVNYWLADHVKDGKKHFNVSKWTDYSVKKKDHKLEELAEEVEEGHMPLPSYTWTHRDAKLSKEQIEAIEAWVKTARMKYAFLKDPQ
ncbi:heme-binding domain-containing protein [Winogradskyella aquimaris]|uniref:Heme-binding domain-containing protein n=1 Tax=Winogradskyella aquimaris TaxID=864074 RepID=A0ABU5ESC1_9FLAO|nr:heme-binding domain-containing protein [Winogradskyella aquimaris]MDY2587776.1 heme-binding domain-containing protein [Winogradskyella aquimaris]